MNLDPETVLRSVESIGFKATGEFSQLNSYENRVFDVHLEGADRIIVKFYRPGRWSMQALSEEHLFLSELYEERIAAVAPIKFGAEGRTLLRCGDLWTVFFPRVRGRLPQEFMEDDFRKMGQILAQLHNIGSREWASHRPTMDGSFPGAWSALEDIEPVLPQELRKDYLAIASEILALYEEAMDPSEFVRIHGDCHRGNWIDDGQSFHLIDFDDFCNGPVIQDFWMLLSGDEDSLESEKEALLSGYSQLRDFPEHQWEWIPLLRGLRMISYAAWIQRRWLDPSFPRLFPEFGTYRYWLEETDGLRKILYSL